MSGTTETIVKPISITEFTDNVTTNTIDYTVTGNGIFDKLMDTATKHLKAQFESNRIREEDYASAYIQIYQTTLQTALEIWLKKGIAEAQLELLAKQIELLAKQTETENTKKMLYNRQIEGFDESFKEKILRIMMDSWGIGFSVAKDSFDAAGIPAPMQKVTIDDLFNKYILTDLDKFKYPRPNDVTVIS